MERSHEWRCPENNGYEAFEVPIPRGLLHAGSNVIAVQVANVNLGRSSDCFFDARLLGIQEPANRGPSPGRPNVVLSTNAPPAIRQVRHLPEQPKPGETVLVLVRMSDPDGVDAVVLEYQVVEPGCVCPCRRRWLRRRMGPNPDGADAGGSARLLGRHPGRGESAPATCPVSDPLHRPSGSRRARSLSG